MLVQSGQPELAQRAFHHMLELDPANGDARRMLADIKARAVPLIAPDPLERPGVKDLLIVRGIFDPNHLMAMAGALGMDISILAGAHTRGGYQSMVRVIGTPASPCPARRRWANLMRRAFDGDVRACPRCGGRLRLIALMDAGAVTARILRHLGLPTELPPAQPARASPLTGDLSW